MITSLSKQRSLLLTKLYSKCCSRRWSSTGEAKALFLWLGEDDESRLLDKGRKHRRLLLPVSAPLVPTVTDSSMVLDLVNQHYASDSQFVGGMGESDPGVWFAMTADSTRDTLDYAELLQSSICAVKQERHGVPFGAYTTGLATNLAVPLQEIGLDSLQVSLFAATPDKYKAATGVDAFGQVCGFIVNAAEQGMAVEVGVLDSEKSTARDLALSLGAQHVHVYDS